MGCWEEDGRPWEKTELAVKWARTFSEASCGPLHVVVDDWNLDDSNIASCRSYAETSAVERELCDALLSMSEGERYATAILADDPAFDPAKWAANRDD
jgi:hypothetical protein